MDITKWKSVLVPIEVYEQIKRLQKPKDAQSAANFALCGKSTKNIFKK
jgi:hypothetical protein